MDATKKKEKCYQCGKKKKEPSMLYVVSADKYFCNQQCWDKYNGIVRE